MLERCEVIIVAIVVASMSPIRMSLFRPGVGAFYGLH